MEAFCGYPTKTTQGSPKMQRSPEATCGDFRKHAARISGNALRGSPAVDCPKGIEEEKLKINLRMQKIYIFRMLWESSTGTPSFDSPCPVRSREGRGVG